MPKNIKRIISLGNTCLDIVLSHTSKIPTWGTETFFQYLDLRLGGQAANFAVAESKLNLECFLVSSIGGDANGVRFNAELNAINNLNLSLLRIEQKKPTGLTVAVVRDDGERLFLSSLGHQKHYSLGKNEMVSLFSLFDKGNFLHVSGIFMLPKLMEQLPEIMKQAKSNKVTISLDTGWDPSGFNRASIATIMTLLQHVDFFIPNQSEILALTGTAKKEEAAKRICREFPHTIICVKEGPSGCSIFESGDLTTKVPAFKTRVVDATGAGDAFDAGFICGLARGMSFKNAAVLGNAVAMFSITRSGNPEERFPVYRLVLKLINNKTLLST